MRYKIQHQSFILLSLLILTISACKKTDSPEPVVVNYNPNIVDDYSSFADKSLMGRWGSYNLHDPSIIKDGETYYIYSTDVAYGGGGQCGIMFRKSKDLVNWNFLGWVFNGVPAKPLEFMKQYQPNYQQLSIWAPYILKVGSEFRLYYSVPGNDIKLACIGLATSTSPSGPWTDKGIVVTCLPSENINAIDPAVMVDENTGKHWMSYGSYSAGIFMIELDPATGLSKVANDKGKLLAFRSIPGQAIEGSEMLYNPELKKYFLFVSYDWLEDTYNVRVGRSDSPEGPYLDINGNDMSKPGDNYPMITAQYRFAGHAGWQGFGHCGLLRDGDKYYYVSQARLASNKYLMDLHIHRMVWTPDGWPVISPERYVNVPQTTITKDSIVGKWEHISLELTKTQNISQNVEFTADGKIIGIEDATWSFADNVLTINANFSEYKARVMNEWDWERKKLTIVYTGMSSSGFCVWGKKLY